MTDITKLAMLLLTLTVTGCASTVTISPAGDVHSADLGFYAKLPPGSTPWEAVSYQRGEVMFQRAGDPGRMSVYVTRGDPKNTGPVRVDINVMFRRFKDRETLEIRSVEVAGQPAVFQDWTAKADGVPMRINTCVLACNHVTYDLAAWAPEKDFDPIAAEFAQFLRSFSIER